MAVPTDTNEAAAALRASGYRATPQRLAVHATLSELGEHVSAERLLAAVSQRQPGVSLPTVYSALEALEEAGLVRRVAAGRGPALYDAGTPDHHHLVCRRCGRVEDLEADLPLEPIDGLAAQRGFAPDRAEVVVHGLCARCR
jgi:Fur family transcriptional regulator, stress-responsive regulator